MSFYLDYTLGWSGKGTAATDKGTVVHKVAEILAKTKKAKQDGKKFIEDDICGKLKVSYLDINIICEQVYDYYSKLFTNHPWTDKDKKDCTSWVWKIIKLNDGMFDPRKRNIFASELRFDFEIKQKWAEYEYEFKGEKLKGNLALKGTIDLVTQEENGILEVIDYKTGKRKDWATDEEYTHEKLQLAPQLRLYFYALSNLYPEIEQILVTIFYINYGGPFTICFTKDDLPSIEEMLRKKFELIKNTTIPRLNKSWKCSKFCHQGMSTFEGTHIEPMIETRHGQVCKKGEVMTKCEQTKLALERNGIDKVTEDYISPLHQIGFYKPPGE